MGDGDGTAETPDGPVCVVENRDKASKLASREPRAWCLWILLGMLLVVGAACVYSAVPWIEAWRREDTFLEALVLRDSRGRPRLLLLFRPQQIIVDQTNGTLRVESEFLPTGELRALTPGFGVGTSFGWRSTSVGAGVLDPFAGVSTTHVGGSPEAGLFRIVPWRDGEALILKGPFASEVRAFTDTGFERLDGELAKSLAGRAPGVGADLAPNLEVEPGQDRR